MRKAIAVVALALALTGCGAEFDRSVKSAQSNLSGGLERRVTLYSTTGEVLGTWEGKIDLSQSEDETLFDLDGKRVVIHGGIVLAEEL